MLWSLGLLALLGSTITAAGRAETKIASNLEGAANAQAAADGGVSVAAFHLLDSSNQHWDPGGPPRRLTIGQSDVTIELRDQRGKIDPNDAPSGLVAALLRQMGVGGAAADTIGLAIVSWRVANDSGEAAAYTAQGRRYGPPHEPFESLDELSLVQGVTPDLLTKLLPHMSLFLEQQPMLSIADKLVAAAVADSVQRDQLTLNTDESPGPLIVQVVATAHSRGATFTRTALLRMNGIADQPYEILDWQGG